MEPLFIVSSEGLKKPWIEPTTPGLQPIHHGGLCTLLTVRSRNKRIYMPMQEKVNQMSMLMYTCVNIGHGVHKHTVDFLHQSPPILGFSNPTDFHFISTALAVKLTSV